MRRRGVRGARSCDLRVARWVLLAAGMVLAFPAQAEGGFVGMGAGPTKAGEGGVSCAEFGLDPGCSGDLNLRDTGWRVFGGYQFHPYAALEAGYVDLGRLRRGDVSGSALGAPASASVESKASGIDASIFGIAPLGGRFGLTLRLGLLRWRVKTTRLASSPLASGHSSERVGGTSSLYGVGVLNELNRGVAVRLEWERYLGVGESSATGAVNVDLVTVSGLFRF